MIRFLNKANFKIKCELPIRGISQVQEVQSVEDTEWKSSSPFTSIPGPSKLSLFMSFLPGGKYHNTTIVDLQKKLRTEYGDLIRLPGGFGKNDVLRKINFFMYIIIITFISKVVFDFNPDDFEKIFREEGQWPIRRGLDTYEYYRTKHRPELFQGIGGLVSE